MKNLKIILTIALILFLANLTCAQTIDKVNYASFTLENDFLYFQDGTDQFYTNGFRYERMGPRFEDRNFLFNKTLFGKKPDDNNRNIQQLYGAYFGQNMYTPVDLTQSDVQPNDRPYSGWIYWGAKRVTTFIPKRKRITAEFSLGILGSESLAGETQTFIHKVSNSTMPQGWSHQIDSDLGINYTLRIEKGLRPTIMTVSGKNKKIKDSTHKTDTLKFEMLAFGEVNAGTVFNNLAVGGLIRFGFMDNYFSSYNFGSNIPQKRFEEQNPKFAKTPKRERSFQLALFARPQVRAIGYNAMLQGGVFNDKSEHKIRASAVTRLFWQIDYGIMWTIRKMTLMYSQSTRTKEFTFGPSQHYWGTVNVIFAY